LHRKGGQKREVADRNCVLILRGCGGREKKKVFYRSHVVVRNGYRLGRSPAPQRGNKKKNFRRSGTGGARRRGGGDDLIYKARRGEREKSSGNWGRVPERTTFRKREELRKVQKKGNTTDEKKVLRRGGGKKSGKEDAKNRRVFGAGTGKRLGSRSKTLTGKKTKTPARETPLGGG